MALFLHDSFFNHGRGLAVLRSFHGLIFLGGQGLLLTLALLIFILPGSTLILYPVVMSYLAKRYNWARRWKDRQQKWRQRWHRQRYRHSLNVPGRLR